MMSTSLLHHPVLLISYRASHYIEEHEGEKKKRTERKVKDKEMHIRNIENGDFFTQRISCKNDVTQEWYHVRAVCLSVQIVQLITKIFSLSLVYQRKIIVRTLRKSLANECFIFHPVSTENFRGCWSWVEQTWNRSVTILDFTDVKPVHFMHQLNTQYFRETAFYLSLTKIYTVKLI